MSVSDYTIWHNPNCSTSRFVLQALRDRGANVTVRDYLAQPPSVAELRAALGLLGIAPRDLLRRKSALYDELGLSDPSKTDDALIGAMADHAVLIERPVVFGPDIARLCRPKERVFDLPAP